MKNSVAVECNGLSKAISSKEWKSLKGTVIKDDQPI